MRFRGCDEVLQVQGGFGHPQQDQLEHAVVHVHPLGVQLHQAPREVELHTAPKMKSPSKDSPSASTPQR